jgi:hypothetical protein
MELSAKQYEIYQDNIERIVIELKESNVKVTRKAIRNIFKLIFPLNDSQCNVLINEYVKSKK